ncbi:hypothetical protein TcBrA4_0101940 [Trypanosoma cruzi]|nr:hypothetical protein TcBrA4_0101940 [Trypanosoma cruzi]
MESNEVLNGARRMGPQRKTDQQRQQQFSADGLLTSEPRLSRARARNCRGRKKSGHNRVAVAREEKSLSAAAAAATTAMEACSATPAGGGGVLHGQWRELRQREMGENDAGR